MDILGLADCSQCLCQKRTVCNFRPQIGVCMREVQCWSRKLAMCKHEVVDQMDGQCAILNLAGSQNLCQTIKNGKLQVIIDRWSSSNRHTYHLQDLSGMVSTVNFFSLSLTDRWSSSNRHTYHLQDCCQGWLCVEEGIIRKQMKQVFFFQSLIGCMTCHLQDACVWRTG